MEKIAIITDSISDISKESVEKYNINVLPFRIIYKDKEYIDGVDITPEEVYRNIEKEVPTSSLPSIKDMENLLISLKEQGYTHAIAVTVSSAMSGVYNAFKLVSEEVDGIECYVYDSKSVSLAEGLIVEEAAKLVEEGKGFEEIIKELPKIKNRLTGYFVLSTLEYLKRGGRIGRVHGTIGELLKIKPIISVGEDGKYYSLDKVRGRKQSLKRLAEIGKSMIDKNSKIFILDGGAKEETLKVYQSVKEYSEKLNKGFVKMMGNISPVAGVHSGPGLIGLVAFRPE